MTWDSGHVAGVLFGTPPSSASNCIRIGLRTSASIGLSRLRTLVTSL
eukprot:CAMPEP_0115535076 /NCGR_PEP_ID=MMETSP0271-20121206/87041_1 /TAXON_ID=71861 /ORGANISM="Scrippsiella trochoidea, Strain CCMP3099" /LENGTH=46 /DNA_ID= /DNA_START= /DNA_END= /DNA_ORIENTATION=